MNIDQFLVPIVELLPEEAVPAELWEGEEAEIGEALRRIYFSNLNIFSVENGVGFELLVIISEEVKINIPGINGLALVFGGGTGSGTTSFHLDFFMGEDVFELIIDQIQMGLRLPKSFLRPAPYADGTPVEGQTQISINGGFLINDMLDIEVVGFDKVNLQPSLIGDTGLIISATDIRMFFNRTKDIPELIEAGFGEDFTGIYIGRAALKLPEGFIFDESQTPELYLENSAIGNGGFSGRIGVDWEDALSLDLFDFQVTLKSLTLELKQNAFTDSSIQGALFIPYFDKWIRISLSIDAQGDFTIQIMADATHGSDEDGESMFEVEIAQVLKLTAKYLGFESKDDILYISGGGEIEILLGGLDWPSFEIEKISIDSEGNLEFDGGWVNIPETFTLDFHGFKLGISEFGFGTEGEGDAQRQWIGLSGEMNLVEGLELGASVEGLKFSWPKEGGTEDDVEVSLKGIAVNFEIPNTLSFEGSVAYYPLTADEPGPGGLTGSFFQGSIKLNLMAVRLEIEAELMIGKLKDAEGHEFTMFYIVLDAELPTGLMLGATGTSLYGIGGLAGIHAAPTKKPDESWYEWYVADPSPRDITSSNKWMGAYDNNAFAVKAKFGTTYDDGTTLNMSVLLAILLPGPVIVLEGKANLLKARSADKNVDGAFYLLAVLDGRAGTFSLNIDVKYSLEDVITIGAGLEAFFDFNDSSNWYIHIGKKEPEAKRIRAEVLSLFHANAYFMISSQSLMLGASVGIDIRERLGPVSLTIVIRISFDAAIFWKPLQLEGSLELEGEIALKIFGVGLGLFIRMLLAGKTPNPFLVHGEVEVGIPLPWPLPDIEFEVEFDWRGGEETKHVWPLLKEASFIHHKGLGTTWAAELVEESDARDFDNFVMVPVDARPVLAFARPLHNLQKHGSEAGEKPIFSELSDHVGGQEFVYQLNELSLARWNGADWDDEMFTGINTGAPDSFTITKDSVVNVEENGVAPQEPKIQLWQYHSEDIQHVYGREGYEERHPACDPKTTLDRVTVNWKGVPHGTTYDNAFAYAGLQFVCDELTQTFPPQVAAENLDCTSITIQFPEPVYLVSVRIVRHGHHIDDITGSVYSGGFRVDTSVAENRPDGIFVFGNPEPHGKYFDAIRLQRSQANQELFIAIQEIIYTTRRASAEISAATGDPHPNVEKQKVNGALKLKPNSYYRLKVQTGVQVKEHPGKQEDKYVYFRTDEGPGIPPPVRNRNEEEPSETETYAGKPVNQLATYITRTFPRDGAKSFYYGYDIGVEFNEKYVERLYQNKIRLRLKDRNGKTVEEPEGAWIESFIAGMPVLMPYGLLTYLHAKEEGGCAATEQPEVPAPYLNFSFSKPCKPNSLYTAEMVTQASSEEVVLHTFQFTTSRYATFSEHILSSYSTETISPIVLPEIPLGREADLSAHKNGIDAVDAKRDEFRTIHGALNKYRMLNELQALAEKGLLTTKKTFAFLDNIAQRSFQKVHMEERPLPDHFEIFAIPIKGDLGNILLLESPEPIDWTRITAKVVIPHLRPRRTMSLGFVWNEDQTRSFLYHVDGHLFPDPPYMLSFVFAGDPNPMSGTLHNKGEIVNEKVVFSLST